MSLAIITPSYIQNKKRLQFAEKSLASLSASTGNQYTQYVVDDVPRLSSMPKVCLAKIRFFDMKIHVPDLRVITYANKVYKEQPNIRLTRQLGLGSRFATIKCIKKARSSGHDLVFIHLDDNIYTETLGGLLEKAIHAFEHNNELMEVRLTGIPILSAKCNAIDGNLSCVKVTENEVCFEKNIFRPVRYDDYTLWKCDYHEGMVDNYWPIALWATIYRAEFLQELLSNPNVGDSQHLSRVERYYVNKSNFKKELETGLIHGKLGYINMQFAGLEMQHNRNWDELINYPNIEVR